MQTKTEMNLKKMKFLIMANSRKKIPLAEVDEAHRSSPRVAAPRFEGKS